MTNDSQFKKYESISSICGMLVAVVSGTALIGWFTGSVLFKGIRPNYIPMAPNTAVIFMLLGMFIVAFTIAPSRFLRLTRLAALLAIIISGIRVCEYLTGID